MPITGNVKTLYEDSSHMTAIWPRTSISAVVDQNGQTVSTLIANKQDTISDLETIRSKSNTAVQPATLESYSTTTEMNTAITSHHDSTKQNLLNSSIVTVDANNWILDSTNNVYYQDVTLQGMTPNQSPWIDVSLSGTLSTMTAILNEYKKIIVVYTLTNAIRVVAGSEPTLNINLIVKR